MTIRREYVLYGLELWEKVFTEILETIGIPNSFDLKLLIVEGLTNAYFHGNKGDEGKPIYLRYCWDGHCIEVEIEDCGPGMDQVKIPERMSEDRLLEGNGRGLYIILSIADELEICNRILRMKKVLV